jgi:hypothetical protein
VENKYRQDALWCEEVDKREDEDESAIISGWRKGEELVMTCIHYVGQKSC